MDDKRFYFKVEAEGNQVKIMEGEALPEKPKKGENISGTIETPLKYLTNREVDFQEAYMLVSRHSKSIILRTDTRNPWEGNSAEGTMELNPEFEAFKINQDHAWDHKTLSKLIRMNRTMFESKSEATKLANAFRDLEIKAQTEMQNMDDEKGSFNVKRSRAIQKISIPDNFSMNAKIHTGGEVHTFSVDVIINPDDFSIQLVSSEMKEAADREADDFINQVIEEAQKGFPELLIYET